MLAHEQQTRPNPTHTTHYHAPSDSLFLMHLFFYILFRTLVVSRINARSENYEMELTLDLNNELYPLEIGEKFSLVLATSLSLSTVVGNDTSGTQESWREKVGGERTLADDYEYVMYGKVYKYDEGQGSKV